MLTPYGMGLEYLIELSGGLDPDEENSKKNYESITYPWCPGPDTEAA